MGGETLKASTFCTILCDGSRHKSTDDFCVVEIPLGDGKSIDLPIRLSKLVIGSLQYWLDHFSLYGGIDAIAAEKGKLVAALWGRPAVLNADDPRVWKCKAVRRTRDHLWFSKEAAARPRYKQHWSNRLAFAAIKRPSIKLRPTVRRPLGSQRAGGDGSGGSYGYTDSGRCRSHPKCTAIPGKDEPVTTPDGVTFIRDDCKAPLWTVRESLEFMRNATAKRKIVVVGTLSDYPGIREMNPGVARQALEVADVVRFVSGTGLDVSLADGAAVATRDCGLMPTPTSN